MFEHFGFRDILSAIKKYISVLFTIFLLSTLFFVWSGASKIKGVLKSSYTGESSDICISSAIYCIGTNIAGNEIAEGSFNYYKSLPDEFESLMDTELCMEFIYDRITSLYEKEYIINNTQLGREGKVTKAGDFNIISIKDLYKAERLKNTILINLSTYTYDKNLSTDILKACEDFLMKNASKDMYNVDIKHVGSVDKTLSPSQVSSLLTSSDNQAGTISESKTLSTTNQAKLLVVTLIKSIIIPVLLVCALCLIIISLIVLFNPTINRKSDFCEYDIPVIGEIKNKKRIKEIN